MATDEFSRLLPEITASTERLRFNVLYRGPQKFAWTEFRWRKSKPYKQPVEPASMTSFSRW